jgi:hypothetical protein
MNWRALPGDSAQVSPPAIWRRMLATNGDAILHETVCGIVAPARIGAD